jgi:hypothetical protein
MELGCTSQSRHVGVRVRVGIETRGERKNEKKHTGFASICTALLTNKPKGMRASCSLRPSLPEGGGREGKKNREIEREGENCSHSCFG